MGRMMFARSILSRIHLGMVSGFVWGGQEFGFLGGSMPTDIILHVILAMEIPRVYLFLGLFLGLYIPLQVSWLLIPFGFILTPRTLLFTSLLPMGMPMWVLLFPISMDLFELFKPSVKVDLKSKED